MIERKAAELQDILLQFSAEQECPDAGLLQKYIQQYPEQRLALTEFAANLVQGRLSPGEPNIDARDELIVQAVMGRYWTQGASDSQSHAVASDIPLEVDNPIERLSRERFSGLAQHLRVPLPFISKLRDRAIQTESIPAAFVARLAAFLKISEQAIRAHLQAEPQLAGLAVIEIEGRRVHQKLSFVEGLRESGLGAEQIELLLVELGESCSRAKGHGA
jgi:hypothetical protein